VGAQLVTLFGYIMDSNEVRFLIWYGKYGNVYIRIDDIQDAYYCVFLMINERGHYSHGNLFKDEQKYYDAARKGDKHAAMRLVQFRSYHGCQYERVEEEVLLNPHKYLGELI